MAQELASIVGPSFKFLLDSFGFKCIVATKTFVRWESPAVFVSCNYDFGRSFELSVEIGQKAGNPERPFNFGEFVRSQAVPEAEWPSGYTAVTPDAVESLAVKLARILSHYGRPLLTDESKAWNRLTDLRDRECCEFALQQELRYAREDAKEAWKAKDFRWFIQCLAQYRGVLEASELEKLKYADSRVSDISG
ncbi:MAG: hypothetical protein WCJ21_07510 [Planctomycetota bacterium]